MVGLGHEWLCGVQQPGAWSPSPSRTASLSHLLAAGLQRGLPLEAPHGWFLPSILYSDALIPKPVGPHWINHSRGPKELISYLPPPSSVPCRIPVLLLDALEPQSFPWALLIQEGASSFPPPFPSTHTHGRTGSLCLLHGHLLTDPWAKLPPTSFCLQGPHSHLSSISHLPPTSGSFIHSHTLLETCDVWLQPVLPSPALRAAGRQPSALCRLSTCSAPTPSESRQPPRSPELTDILLWPSPANRALLLFRHCPPTSPQTRVWPVIFPTVGFLLSCHPLSLTPLHQSQLRSSMSSLEHEKFLFLTSDSPLTPTQVIPTLNSSSHITNCIGFIKTFSLPSLHTQYPLGNTPAETFRVRSRPSSPKGPSLKVFLVPKHSSSLPV